MLRLVALIAGVLAWTPGLAQAQGRGAELPPGEGRELVQKVCTSCHTLVPVMMKRDGVNGWRHTVGRMVLQRQAQLTPAEFDTVVRYLSTALGPAAGQMPSGPLPPGALAGGAATAKEVKLPDGAGRPLVEGRCASCHDLDNSPEYIKQGFDAYWEKVQHKGKD